VQRNFTDAEVTYCRAQPDPAASFAARWAGKEAVFKALGVPSKGAGAAMKDIEILPDDAGVPRVTLHGEAKDAAEGKNITTMHVSLSHSEVCWSPYQRSACADILAKTVAIAFATAQS
jgi:fatty acid synthase subunit alpha, fungi type/fatty acid synthase subunit beta, fungi type